jgi:hypothetical protein
MKTLFSLITAFFFAATAWAEPLKLCSQGEVAEAASNLKNAKASLEQGNLAKNLYLDHERAFIQVQHCAGVTVKETYCHSMVANLKEQLSVVRGYNDRSMALVQFEKYISAMTSLRSVCEEFVSE